MMIEEIKAKGQAMSREVRKVPANWQHPIIEVPNWHTGCMQKRFQPMHDRPFACEMREWFAGWEAWERGERPEYASEAARRMAYWEWAGPPPDPAYYRPDWQDAERTHLMMYETVSEGTPLSPSFETPDQLAHWLTDNNANFYAGTPGTFEQWLEIAQGGLPSTCIARKLIESGVQACGQAVQPVTGT